MNKKIRDGFWISTLVFIVAFVASFSVLSSRYYHFVANSSFAYVYADKVSDEYTQQHYGLSYQAWANKENEKCKSAHPDDEGCHYPPLVTLVTDNEVFLAYVEEHPFAVLFVGVELTGASMCLGLIAMTISLFFRSLLLTRKGQ